MKLWVRKPFILFTLLLLLACSSRLTDQQKLDNFFKKKSVTILVTDSGLGGVSIAADVVERMKTAGIFETARVVFFNAQPHIKSGYNSMKTTDRKVRVFENALNAMEQNFHPDLILIGCNTLSVLYPYTKFSQKATIPVVGIVKTGVKLIERELKKTPDAEVFIFATKTTVRQGKHKKMLLEAGIPEEQIVTQACPHLAGSIERGTDSEETRSLVKKYVDAALEKFPQKNKPVFISFNCTHYGYIADLFKENFLEKGYQVRELLDPNPLMADFIFHSPYQHRFDSTTVTVKIVSQPKMSAKRIQSISALIEKVSPQTANALRSYQFVPDFFEWRSIAEEHGKE